jgi:hypothetical protein
MASHALAKVCRNQFLHSPCQVRLYSVTPRQIIQMVWDALIPENTLLASQMPFQKSTKLFEQIEFLSGRLHFGARLAFCEFTKP